MTIDLTINQPILELNVSPVAIKGDKGDEGISAYDVAVSMGFIGTQQEWLDSFRDRTTHINTQPISTITNLQSSLDGKQPIGDYATNTALTTGLATKENADATILKEVDLGVLIQPYNANTVIDSNYIQTEENYTTTEKNKLAGIESGVEVNVIPDWTVITNKPNFGTASLTSSTDYATASQGVKADSAVQPLDLTNGLATKEPVISTGTSAQYWRGDKTFQTLDKNAVGLSNVDNISDLNKPVSTATQTALNLKANINSPTFTGNLVFPNNTRINGVEHFYQNTKPTIRGDGSPLVVGDRWYKIEGGSEWFWNGTYWLSVEDYIVPTSNNNVPILVGTPRLYTPIYGSPTQSGTVIIKTIFTYYETQGTPPTLDDNNYYQISTTGDGRGVIQLKQATPPVTYESNMFCILENRYMVYSRIELGGAGNPSFGSQYRYALTIIYKKYL